MAKNEALLRKVFAYASELGPVPIVLLGDVNVKPELSMAIAEAITHNATFKSFGSRSSVNFVAIKQGCSTLISG